MNTYIFKIQKLLNKLGYPVKSTDGVFDNTTKAMLNNVLFDFGVEEEDIKSDKDILNVLETIYISDVLFELYEGIEEVFE